MTNVWGEVLGYLISVVNAIFVAAVVTGIGYGIKYLLKKTEHIENETAKNIIKSALQNGQLAAQQAVLAVDQQFISDLREAAKDGKITKKEAKQALDNAKAKFLNVIDEKSLEVLKKSLGPVEIWLEDFIESQIATLKQSGMITNSKAFDETYKKILEATHPKD